MNRRTLLSHVDHSGPPEINCLFSKISIAVDFYDQDRIFFLDH
jgi:hypothetical protein